MTLTIELKPDQESQLRAKALESGHNVEDYVERLIERALAKHGGIRDLYAPVRAQIKESGISDAELDVLLEEAREEVYEESLSGTLGTH
jgi:hypothetical protein